MIDLFREEPYETDCSDCSIVVNNLRIRTNCGHRHGTQGRRYRVTELEQKRWRFVVWLSGVYLEVSLVAAVAIEYGEVLGGIQRR